MTDIDEKQLREQLIDKIKKFKSFDRNLSNHRQFFC